MGKNRLEAFSDGVLVRRNLRNYISLAAYVMVTVVSGFWPIAAYILMAAVTIWWIIPQRKKKSDPA